MTYGINSHGSAYINNFGVAAMAMVIATAPATLEEAIPALGAIGQVLSAKPVPFPSL